jgi:uncharacterized protein YukE
MRVQVQGSIAYPTDADPAVIVELADDLGQLAAGLEVRGTSLRDTAGQTSSVWTGPASSAFVDHLDGRSQTVRQAGDTVSSAAPALRQYAAAIEATQVRYTDAVRVEVAARRGLPETEEALRMAIDAQRDAVEAHQSASARVARSLQSIASGVEQARSTLTAATAAPSPSPSSSAPLTAEIERWTAAGLLTTEQRDRLLQPANLARLEEEIRRSGRTDEESRANRARIIVNTTDENDRDLRLQQLAIAEARRSPYVVNERGFVNTFGTDNRGELTGGVTPTGEAQNTDGLRIVDVARTDGVRERRVYGTDALGRERLLGTDYGPVAEYMAAVPAGAGGDRPEALRRQVALPDSQRDLSDRFIDPGSGQVDPARWNEFVEETRRRGLTQMVTANGIDNQYGQGLDNARILAEGFTNGDRQTVTVNVYNPTSGFGADLGESARAQFGERQAAQYAIRSEVDRALAVPGGGDVIVLGHSQGSINTNAGVEMISDPGQRSRIQLINVGTAAWSRPDGVGSYLNVVDRGDVVWNAVAGASEPRSPSLRAADQAYAEMYGRPSRPDNPNTVVTDFRRDGGPVAPNNHSLWLYLSRPEAFRGYNLATQPLTSPFPIPRRQ